MAQRGLQVRDKEEFMAQQRKLQNAAQLMQGVVTQHDEVKTELRRKNIVLKELESLPDGGKGVRAFQGVGRMFVHTNIEELVPRVKGEIAELETQAEKFDSQEKYLQKQIDATQQAIRELIVS